MRKNEEKKLNLKKKFKKLIFDGFKFFLDIPMKVFRWLHLRFYNNKIFLIGVPTHGNLGDQAIFLAEIEFLRYFFPNYKVIQLEEEEKNDYVLKIRKFIAPSDLIFLHGGGNFGDYYLENEELRRLIISEFKLNKIIFFPQTFDFSNRTELEKSKAIYLSHSNLHIVLREKKSFEECQSVFKNHLYLCPDIVFFLDNYTQRASNNKIILCLRRDFEKKIDDEMIISILKNKNYFVTDTVVSFPVLAGLRKYMVNKKLKQVASSTILVTDRLHGMIFGLISNTETYVFQNFNHKIISTYDTWLKSAENIHFVTNPNQIKEIHLPYEKERTCLLHIELRKKIIDTYKEIFSCE